MNIDCFWLAIDQFFVNLHEDIYQARIWHRIAMGELFVEAEAIPKD